MYSLQRGTGHLDPGTPYPGVVLKPIPHPGSVTIPESQMLVLSPGGVSNPEGCLLLLLLVLPPPGVGIPPSLSPPGSWLSASERDKKNISRYIQYCKNGTKKEEY